jgi:TRAP-type C4-dicarboxylate transport system permease large subunit
MTRYLKQYNIPGIVLQATREVNVKLLKLELYLPGLYIYIYVYMYMWVCAYCKNLNYQNTLKKRLSKVLKE